MYVISSISAINPDSIYYFLPLRSSKLRKNLTDARHLTLQAMWWLACTSSKIIIIIYLLKSIAWSAITIGKSDRDHNFEIGDRDRDHFLAGDRDQDRRSYFGWSRSAVYSDPDHQFLAIKKLKKGTFQKKFIYF